MNISLLNGLVDSPSFEEPVPRSFREMLNSGGGTSLDPIYLPRGTISICGIMSYNAPQSTPIPSAGSSSPFSGSLLPFEKYIVAHAVFCAIGFGILLPTGALVARLMRTFNNLWFKLHWIIQWVVALPVIVIGIALGATAVKMSGVAHLNDPHKKWGIALFVLYLLQLALGGFVHFHKIPCMSIHHRSLQNYFHALIGILIMLISFYQIRTGITVEWPTYTGRPISAGASAFWVFWVILVLLGYCGGLLLLRRQYRQEREKRTSQLGIRMGFTPLAPTDVRFGQPQYI